QHSALGRHSIEIAEVGLGTTAEFLLTAKEIAGSHHERWDGRGYPEGLAGEAIPLSARLMALADVYDALYSRRAYKDASPHRAVRRLIPEGRATQSDPDVVDAFEFMADEFRQVAERHADPH